MPERNKPHPWLAKFPRRKSGNNKYDYGHAVIFGAAKMTGATRLAAESCARIGAGVTTVIAPSGTGEIYRRTLKPHVIVEDLTKNITTHLKDSRRNVVLIGPGAGKNFTALRKIIKVTLASGKDVVLDADALNAIAPLKGIFKRKGQVVITPHAGEFKKLFPSLKGSKAAQALAAAKKSGAIVVLKGADTVIASPEGKAVVSNNAPATLATAGTGDVLAGMITGLVAQGMSAFEAACAAVWLHGEAAKGYGPGLVASDLPDLIPVALKWVI